MNIAQSSRFPLMFKRCAFLVFFLWVGRPSHSTQPKPNIVVILADDLGWGSVGSQGCEDIPTPNIDALAKSGARLTSGYSTCPVCAPSRAGLLTGQYQQRFGLEVNPPAPPNQPRTFGLPSGRETLASRLKAAGYATCAIGKWHLGASPAHHPMRAGFDEFFGYVAGGNSYFPADGSRGMILMRGTDEILEEGYATEMFAREATDFVHRHRNEPFFLYFAPNAVHTPLQARPFYLDRFAHMKDEKRRVYAATLSALDDAVSQIMTQIKSDGLEENTLVFFLSDNGGPTRDTTSSNGPFRGEKTDVLEGGIRVPFIIQWKGRIPAGQVISPPVISLDIAATALAAAGCGPGESMKLDGRNLIPLLTGESPHPPHDALFWRYGRQKAVRKGRWKLVQVENGTQALYDLDTDLGESQDLKEREPALYQELLTELHQWEQSVKQRRSGAVQSAARKAKPSTARTTQRPPRKAKPSSPRKPKIFSTPKESSPLANDSREGRSIEQQLIQGTPWREAR